MKPVCFSIMPFDKDYEEISDIIRDAAKDCGLEYVRGDLRKQPGSVLPQIVEDIRNATVVVVDITGHNPNVFYELGIAHQQRGPEQVVIITRSAADSPYDVREFRQLEYSHSPDGRNTLARELPAALHAALNSEPDRENWSVIRGRVQRTKVIVRDLRRLVGASDDEGASVVKKVPNLEGVVIRSASGVSSLAISDHEQADVGEGPQYDKSLREERDTLSKAMLAGATFKGLLNPPRVFAQGMIPERLKVRYRRMIGLLRSQSDFEDSDACATDLDVMKQCIWALNPVPMPNLLIIGDQVAYEGFKRGGTRGFERTHCETNSEAIGRMIEEFDAHFEDYLRLQRVQGDLADQLEEFLKQAEAHELR